MKAKEVSDVAIWFGTLCFLIGLGAITLVSGKTGSVICYCGLFAYAICTIISRIASNKIPDQSSDTDADDGLTGPNNNNSEINPQKKWLMKAGNWIWIGSTLTLYALILMEIKDHVGKGLFAAMVIGVCLLLWRMLKSIKTKKPNTGINPSGASSPAKQTDGDKG